MMDPLQELGPLGQLIIREASYRIASLEVPGLSAGGLDPDRFRRYWAKAPLRWCYEQAGTLLRAYPFARYR